MTTIQQLIYVFEQRLEVAQKKVSFGFESKYYNGVADSYSEVIKDPKQIINTGK